MPKTTRLGGASNAALDMEAGSEAPAVPVAPVVDVGPLTEAVTVTEELTVKVIDGPDGAAEAADAAPGPDPAPAVKPKRTRKAQP